MTEKSKYKVGDKVWVQGEIIEADYGDLDSTYQLSIGEDDYNSKRWFPNSWFKDNKIQSNQQLVTKTLPKVTQAVMEWYEEVESEKADCTIRNWLASSYMPTEVEEWLYGENHLENQHALATLIAYGPEAVEVEKEKKYRVRLKNVKNRWGQVQKLAEFEGNYYFSGVEVSQEFTKQELIEAGFEGVFDNPMFEVEEVE